MVFFAYNHVVIKYGIMFWRNSANECRVFLLQDRIIRIISGVGHNTSCKNFFKNLDLSPVSCEYILFDDVC